MRQELTELVVHTRGRRLYEFTHELLPWIRETGIRKGLLTLYVRHTSASLLIQENADPDVREDLERYFARVVPDGDAIYQHTLEGPDDMPAHVRTALTVVTLSVPFRDRHMMLGTWQGIYLWEHRTASHCRLVAVHLLGE